MSPRTQLWLFQFWLPAAGLALIVLGERIGFTLAVEAGFLCLAGAALVGGLVAVRLRRVAFVGPGQRFELHTWEGPAAVAVGAAFAILGFTLAAFTLAHVFGMSLPELRDLILARPGLVAAPVGLYFVLQAAAIWMGFPEWGEPEATPLRRLLLSIPHRIGAVILFSIGLLVLGVGTWELAAPDAFDRALDRLSHGWPW